MGRLDKKVAIVTGGARGIGLAIAKRYVAEGARVVIADIDETAGKAAAAGLGGAAKFVRTDVGAAGDARNVVAEATALTGDLDILVNNAGIIHTADFLDIAEADFDRVLRINLKGMFLVGQVGCETNGRAGQGRQDARRDRQHELDQRARRDPEPGALLRVEGRRRSAHQGDGAVALAATASASTRSDRARS